MGGGNPLQFSNLDNEPVNHGLSAADVDLISSPKTYDLDGTRSITQFLGMLYQHILTCTCLVFCKGGGAKHAVQSHAESCEMLPNL